MEEIEFKAWHKNNKSICYNVTTDLLNRDYLVFLQYIGYKDKNGKKIFNKDILLYEGKYYLVCWNKYYWELDGFYDSCFDVPYDAFSEMNFNEVENIGSIYENLDIELEGEDD